MSDHAVNKTYEEINARINAGEAVVVTAEEMVDIVDRQKKKIVEKAEELIKDKKEGEKNDGF